MQILLVWNADAPGADAVFVLQQNKVFCEESANSQLMFVSAGTNPEYHIWTVFVQGIGMDTCVIPLRHGGLSLVQTTDYIYPIVDDPYMMVSFPLCY